MKEFRLLTEEEVEISIEIEPETIPVRGNAINSGDRDFDRYWEDEILKQKESTVWAWATVTVVVKHNKLSGVCVLCKCHFFSEDDFKANGYYEEMKMEALSNLNYKRLQVHERVTDLLDIKIEDLAKMAVARSDSNLALIVYDYYKRQGFNDKAIFTLVRWTGIEKDKWKELLDQANPAYLFSWNAAKNNLVKADISGVRTALNT